MLQIYIYSKVSILNSAWAAYHVCVHVQYIYGVVYQSGGLELSLNASSQYWAGSDQLYLRGEVHCQYLS